jgi:hypothetical protein
VRQGLQFGFPKSCAFVVRISPKAIPSSVVFFLPGHDVGVGWSEAPAEPEGRSVLGRSGSRCPHRVRRRLGVAPDPGHASRRRSSSTTICPVLRRVFRLSLLSPKIFRSRIVYEPRSGSRAMGNTPDLPLMRRSRDERIACGAPSRNPCSGNASLQSSFRASRRQVRGSSAGNCSHRERSSPPVSAV